MLGNIVPFAVRNLIAASSIEIAQPTEQTFVQLLELFRTAQSRLHLQSLVSEPIEHGRAEALRAPCGGTTQDDQSYPVTWLEPQAYISGLPGQIESACSVSPIDQYSMHFFVTLP
jgi:hypothetical protein